MMETGVPLYVVIWAPQRSGHASSSTYNNQVFWEPKYLCGHGHLAPDIPLCSQVLYWLIVDPQQIAV